MPELHCEFKVNLGHVTFLFLIVRHVFYIRMFGNSEPLPLVNPLIPQNTHAPRKGEGHTLSVMEYLYIV